MAPVAFAQNTRDEVRFQGDGDICGTLAAEPGMKQTTYIAFDPAQVTSVTNRSNPQPGDPCHTLHLADPPIVVRMREGKEGGGKGPLVSEDQSLTLATGNDQILATPINTQLGLRGAETSNTSREGVGIGNPGDPAFTLQAAHHHGVQAGMVVRRLTPKECARLQGFPDDYLDITFRGKPAADGNKYKALGNSWAVPVVRWIGEQIKAQQP
jgi:DNA (cytosine-5)-methyltransferase 1